MWHPNSAKPGAKLEAQLQLLFVFVVGRVFNDDGIIAFADLSTLLLLGLLLPLDLYLRLWGEGGGGRDLDVLL
jgi:hypothetical protein